MSTEQVPPRPDPVETPDRTLRLLVSLTVGVNLLLALLTLAGWLARPDPCTDACSWRPAGGMLWVVLVVLDVGLVLVWAGVGYVHLLAIGERIGRRMADRREGPDGPSDEG
jgi:hypothetical protein